MGRTLKTIAAGIGVLGVAAVGTFYILGPERVWRLAGDPDQGAVDWDHLDRSSHPNDSLACSIGACATPADITISDYDEEPLALMERVERVIRSGLLSGQIRRVDDAQDPLYRRYVVRTPILGYPDTLNVAVRNVDGKSGLLLYSRSLLGKSDMGANEKRLHRIIEGLRRKALGR